MMKHDRDSQYAPQDRIADGGQVALLERDPYLEGDTLVDTLFQSSISPVQDHTTEAFPLPPTRSGGRFIILAVVLIVVTLAMALSLLYLAESRSTSHPETVTKLLAPLFHLPLIRMTLISMLGIAGSCVLFFIGLAFSIVSALIRPKKSDSFVPVTAFALGIPAEEIQFPPLLGDYQVNGLFVPHQGATTTIIISPGYRRTYQDVLSMCKHLWQASHNVLIFEYYGHGSVIGVPITLGYREINDFLGAVEYAKRRTPSARLGALGYSMGGAVSIMGSARSQEIEAVVADSAFATHWSAVEIAIHRTLRFSSYWPRSIIRLLHWITDQVLWLRAGYHFHQVEPLRDIKKLAPRPILIIHGLGDTVVDPRDAQLLYQAAGKPKALWLLPDTEHIKAYFTDSPAYVARVTEFFDHRLKGIQHQKNIQASTQIEPLRKQGTAPVRPEKATMRGQDQFSQESMAIHSSSARQESSTNQVAIPTWRSSLESAYEALIYRFRCMLVPVSMQLMGRGNWWFSWRSRALRINAGTPPTLLTRPTSARMFNGEQDQRWSALVLVEQTLIGIFAQTLDLPREQVKANSDFFQLGGDADTLAALLNRIGQHCQVHLTPNDVFNHPILFRLAAVVQKQQAAIQQSAAVYA